MINETEKHIFNNIQTNLNKIFNVSISFKPKTRKKIKLLIQLNSSIKDSVEIYIEP